MAQVLFLSLAIMCLLFRLSAPTGIRLRLTHVDAKLNLTETELSRRGVERTKHRVASLTWSLASTGNNVQAPLHWAQASYQIDIAIGTPSIPLTVIADTGSDLIWTQCAPCQCFPQPNAIYDPSKSNTFSKLECSSPLCQSLPSDNGNCVGTDCGYSYGYVDGSYTKGLVASETFAFGSADSVPGVAFGCGRANKISNSDGSAGIVGLGRGPLSLVSQLGAGKFSYCLTSYGESRTSPLLIGSLASLSGAAQSTPLVQNPYRKSLYFLRLQGISVGSTLLPIPSTVFALDSDGSGGMVIDSGSTYSILQSQGYDILKQEFQSQVNLPVADGSRTGFDLCFSYPADASPQAVSIPKLVFHFDGADMEFPQSNYMGDIVDAGLLCLAMVRGEADGASILGGFQQQNMHVLYDLSGNALSFEAAQCDQL